MQQDQSNVVAHDEASTAVLNILVKHNLVTGGALAALGRISEALAAEFGIAVAAAPETAANGLSREPVVKPKKSVFPEYIVCLFDGQKLKMLKRYLRTHYNMTPDQYRQHFNLPADYPMVAPAYSERRSELAKATGLGVKPGSRGSRKATAPAPTPAAETPAASAPKASAAKVTHTAPKAAAKAAPKSAAKSKAPAAEKAVQSEAAQAAADLAKAPEAEPAV